MTPLIYADACAQQRVFDSLRTPEVEREIRAMERIVLAVESGTLELVWSAFLTQECIIQMPPEKSERRIWAEHLQNLARHHIDRNREISERASDLVRLAGVKLLDALHLAAAESLLALYITVDRKSFLDRVRRAGISRTLVMTPPEAVAHLQLG